ncbi:hypothetical protein EV401DRAFT_1539829 [Pisolithus croceorrhizus]|nr:hypothetical protein EV401DRAFT_1539829 [Pisolithus croceorrhizus]
MIMDNSCPRLVVSMHFSIAALPSYALTGMSNCTSTDALSLCYSAHLLVTILTYSTFALQFLVDLCCL